MARSKTVSRGAAALMSIVLMSGLVACGGPRVQISVENKAITEVGNWSVIWEGDYEPPEDTLTASQRLLQESQYEQGQACRAYVQRVAGELRSQHGLNFYDNMPIEGLIVMRIKGSIYKEYYARQTQGEWVRGPGDTEYRVPDPYSPGAKVSLNRGDKVVFVSIEIHGIDDRILARVTLAGNEQTEIEPKHVAKAIKKAIENET